MADILVRGVPAQEHEELKRRADAKGLTLQTYLLGLIQRELSRPTMEEWLQELRRLPKVNTTMTGAEAVRAAREELP